MVFLRYSRAKTSTHAANPPGALPVRLIAQIFLIPPHVPSAVVTACAALFFSGLPAIADGVTFAAECGENRTRIDNKQ
jgi:hypothetical protein